MSSFTSEWTYDIFLSFRGEDTRYGFTGHLYNALQAKGIETFMDDEKLRRGEEISPALLKAIQESRFSVIVFSPNYASSTWCLEELTHILECIKEKGRLVWPIFYNVDPSEVRHQTGTYGEGLAKHEETLEDNKEKVQKWRLVLKQASNLSGWHLRDRYVYEYEFIRQIVHVVSSKLDRHPLPVADYPVGLESRISELNSYLSDHHVTMAGIIGMGGIGKTTLARAVYNLFGDQFEGLCFLADVRENSIKHGLVHLQETILSDILGEKGIKLSDAHIRSQNLYRKLSRKKVLMILDDVNELKQLRILAGGCNWFGSGSKTIITTKNKRLLAAHGVEKIYEVPKLRHYEALELLSWNAFKRSRPDECYSGVWERAVNYAHGLPLALNVIGSDLLDRTVDEWECALDKYEKVPHEEIQNVLKVSFDSLNEDEKEIFLDIACFFTGESLAYVEEVLHACGFYPKYHLKVLIDKSLISCQASRLWMHDLLKDMGREIIRQESPWHSGKRSRLWFYEDVLQVLEDNMGTDQIKGIMLDHVPQGKEIVQWSGRAFKKMKSLRILIVKNGIFSQGPKHLPNSLRVLDWRGYPSRSLPPDFCPKKLAMLNLADSCLILDKDNPFKNFECLTTMNFSGSKLIKKIPDFSGVPNLKKLYLDFCCDLIEVHDSIGFLGKLEELSAAQCTNLRTIPHAMKLTSLRYLSFFGCTRLTRFPDILGIMENISFINLWQTALQDLPCSIGNLVGLESLYIRECICLNQLPSSIFSLPRLREIDAEDCSGFKFGNDSKDREQLNSTGSPSMIRLYLSSCNLSDACILMCLRGFLYVSYLDLSCNNFTILPECVKECVNSEILLLQNCKQLQEISGLPPNAQEIDALNCTSLSFQSSNLLLSQAFRGVEYIDIVVFKRRIPQWFDHCSKGGSVSFWVDRKFPAIAVFFLLEGENETNNTLICDFCLLINGLQVYQTERELLVDHVYLFDLRISFTGREWQSLNEHLKPGWNHVQISCTVKNTTQTGKVKCCGIHLYKERMNIHDISFINPDHHGSNLAYEDMEDALDIYDEDEDDVEYIFYQVLAEYLPENEIAEFMQNAQSNKRDDEDDNEENGNDYDDLEVEELSTFINHQIPESYETDTKPNGKGVLVYSSNDEEILDDKSNKLILGSSSPPKSVYEDRKTLELRRKGKLNEDFNTVLVEASTGTVSTSTDRHTVLIKIKHDSCDKAERIEIQVPEKRVNEELGKIEDNMEAFYASIETESSALPLPQNSLKTRPSEETQIKLQYLRDLLLKNFSLLLHPGRSGHMKNVLYYLLSLSPEDGISLRLRSAMLQLSTSFSPWSSDYNNASLKLESATEILSNVEKLQEGLETNVKEFREAEAFENVARSQLANLEARKRELEKQINTIKAEIADFKLAMDDAAQRKRKLFENGRVIKSQMDDSRNKVPRLRAEQEWARRTQANIESEWSKLVQQFIESSSFGEMI